MEITESRKFNKFISDSRDSILYILKKRISPNIETYFYDIFQDSAIILYEKIESGNLTTLKCKNKSEEDGESYIEIPVLASAANKSLMSYLTEICYRQTLKYYSKKHNNSGDLNKKYKEQLQSQAKDAGMSVEEYVDVMGGYKGFMDADHQLKEIEMDGDISNEQYLEILNVCSEKENSIYQEIVSQALDTLATKCREILKGYYTDKRTSWHDIAHRFGIQGGANSVKVSAGRCRKRLTQKCHEIERLQYGR